MVPQGNFVCSGHTDLNLLDRISRVLVVCMVVIFVLVQWRNLAEKSVRRCDHGALLLRVITEENDQRTTNEKTREREIERDDHTHTRTQLLYSWRLRWM